MMVRLAVSFGARARGLLGRKRAWLGEGGVLVITGCASVHTFGMRDFIDVAFVDAAGEVIKAQRGLAPGRVCSCRGAVAALERFSPRERETDCQQTSPWFSVGQRLSLSFEEEGHV